MKAALIAVSALACVLAIALVAVVLGGSTVTVGGLPELENEGDAPAAEEDGPTRRIETEVNDGSGWEDVDLEIELIEARVVEPPREDTVGVEEPGQRWIAAQFEVRNRSSDATDDSPTLYVVDSDGQRHGPAISSVVDPRLDQLSIPPGGRRKGYLTVQAPDGARVERLEVQLIGETFGWDLDKRL